MIWQQHLTFQAIYLPDALEGDLSVAENTSIHDSNKMK